MLRAAEQTEGAPSASLRSAPPPQAGEDKCNYSAGCRTGMRRPKRPERRSRYTYSTGVM
jgi:hypothetical protein